MSKKKHHSRGHHEHKPVPTRMGFKDGFEEFVNPMVEKFTKVQK